MSPLDAVAVMASVLWWPMLLIGAALAAVLVVALTGGDRR